MVTTQGPKPAGTASSPVNRCTLSLCQQEHPGAGRTPAAAGLGSWKDRPMAEVAPGRRDPPALVPAPVVRRGVWIVAGLAVLLLAAFGGGYGYHRDELYFQAAGRHPAFGYPDQ